MHLTEFVIEKFVFNPNLFNQEEIESIKSHISECSKCNELYNYCLYFYQNYKSLSKCSLDEIDIKLANIISQTKHSQETIFLLPAKEKELFKIKNQALIIKKNLNYALRKFVNFIKENPFKGTTLSFAFLLIIGFTFSLIINKLFQKPTPDYAINDYGIIKIFDNRGNFLWKIKTYNLPPLTFDSLSVFSHKNSMFTLLSDIDGDGVKEFLTSAALYETHDLDYNDTLYCFNSDGSLRWKTYPETDKFNYAAH